MTFLFARVGIRLFRERVVSGEWNCKRGVATPRASIETPQEPPAPYNQPREYYCHEANLTNR